MAGQHLLGNLPSKRSAALGSAAALMLEEETGCADGAAVGAAAVAAAVGKHSLHQQVTCQGLGAQHSSLCN